MGSITYVSSKSSTNANTADVRKAATTANRNARMTHERRKKRRLVFHSSSSSGGGGGG